MDLSSALPEQRSFIEHPSERPALLAAGPGTGKTWVLERRSEHLVSAGVDPDDVAVLTLTRSLSVELSERIPHGSASTLHSFALRHLNLLREAWGRIVVSPWEQREIVREDLALGYKIAFDAGCSVTTVDAFLKKLGASFRDDQELPADLSPTEGRLRQIFIQHRELFGYRLMDELSYDLVRLIEAGTQLQRPPTHLLVDEYQDLTAGELRLLQLMQEWCGVTVNAAGDDRQSIYGFVKPTLERSTGFRMSMASTSPTTSGVRVGARASSAILPILSLVDCRRYLVLKDGTSSRGRGEKTRACCR